MQHWLLRTEPSTSGIDDLQAAPRKTTSWEGVRNYQARNFIRDRIKKGDEAFTLSLELRFTRRRRDRTAKTPI